MLVLALTAAVTPGCVVESEADAESDPAAKVDPLVFDWPDALSIFARFCMVSTPILLIGLPLECIRRAADEPLLPLSSGPFGCSPDHARDLATKAIAAALQKLDKGLPPDAAKTLAEGAVTDRVKTKKLLQSYPGLFSECEEWEEYCRNKFQ